MAHHGHGEHAHISHLSNQGRDEHAHTSHWIAEHKDELVKAVKQEIHISAEAMNVVWGNDDRFWKWSKLPKHELPKVFSNDETCFETVAELNQVCWLEVTGSLDLAKHKDQLCHGVTYEVIYHIKFKADAFGWHDVPVTFALNKVMRSENFESHRGRSHGWHEIHGGEFKLSPNQMTHKLEFGMYEVESKKWKGGVLLAGVTIRPNHTNGSN